MSAPTCVDVFVVHLPQTGVSLLRNQAPCLCIIQMQRECNWIGASPGIAWVISVSLQSMYVVVAPLCRQPHLWFFFLNFIFYYTILIGCESILSKSVCLLHVCLEVSLYRYLLYIQLIIAIDTVVTHTPGAAAPRACQCTRTHLLYPQRTARMSINATTIFNWLDHPMHNPTVCFSSYVWLYARLPFIDANVLSHALVCLPVLWLWRLYNLWYLTLQCYLVVELPWGIAATMKLRE